MFCSMFADSAIPSCAALSSRSPSDSSRAAPRAAGGELELAPLPDSSLNAHPCAVRDRGVRGACAEHAARGDRLWRWMSPLQLWRQRCEHEAEFTNRRQKKSSHNGVFSLKTSGTLEIRFHSEMHHNVFPVLPPPQPEEMVGGGH